jgi:hypothetical protein
MLSFSNIPVTTGKAPKSLKPGQRMCKINDITLAPGYNHDKTGAYDLVLHLEGVDMGDDFEGFLIDRDNESLGRYKGQIGRVLASQYSFEDKVLNPGMSNEIKISRDLGIMKFLVELSGELGVQAQLQQISAETIEEMVQAAAVLMRDTEFIEFTIAGREYTDKGGYTAYYLFLPKFKGGKKPFAAEGNEAKLLQYNEAEHIVKKKEAKTTEGFEPSAAAAFEM